MEIAVNVDAKDTFFEYNNYEEFTAERLKLNYEHTLKIWYALPAGLPNLDDGPLQRRTPSEQRTIFRKLKIYYVYSKIFKRSCLKKKIYARGTKLCNRIFNMPPLPDDTYYELYESLSNATTEFFDEGKKYDPQINFDELFKASRLLWTIIALQVQFNMPVKMTHSIFGYNMLYPYTDDFVDCTSVPQSAKKEFSKVFHERLLIGEPTYDPKSRFNGKQTSSADLQLPPSLQPYADKIGKVFDMVKFVENDWIRRSIHDGVFMALATIHDSQIKSTLQHARPDDGYEPTMAQIEQVSADKGGASLIAAGILIEGRLTRAKIAYLEFIGFGMQLVDDLQDVELDMKNNHRTIFTQSIAEGKMLDAPTSRLIQYFYNSPVYEDFAFDLKSLPVGKANENLPRYAYRLLAKVCVLLILEAASRMPQYYSRDYYRELSTYSPLPFSVLRRIGIEDKLMTIIRHQWF